jgi:hypothetical protein
MTPLEQQVESLIDQHGLEGVMAALVQVCRDKAENVESDRAWDRTANRLGSLFNAFTLVGFP